MAIIQTAGLSKRYRNRWAVDHLDLLLDELINGLDPEGIREMRELLLRLNMEVQGGADGGLLSSGS